MHLNVFQWPGHCLSVVLLNIQPDPTYLILSGDPAAFLREPTVLEPLLCHQAGFNQIHEWPVLFRSVLKSV